MDQKAACAECVGIRIQRSIECRALRITCPQCPSELDYFQVRETYLIVDEAASRRFEERGPCTRFSKRIHPDVRVMRLRLRPVASRRLGRAESWPAMPFHAPSRASVRGFARHHDLPGGQVSPLSMIRRVVAVRASVRQGAKGRGVASPAPQHAKRKDAPSTSTRRPAG
ncbi:hypothetical protein F5Y14DRAFT_434326 [Nemania sp. NC0429]|nr:hypothetical protein F5Y14DRAFT_434326 [Nemania sp. NC0429]